MTRSTFQIESHKPRNADTLSADTRGTQEVDCDANSRFKQVLTGGNPGLGVFAHCTELGQGDTLRELFVHANPAAQRNESVQSFVTDLQKLRDDTSVDDRTFEAGVEKLVDQVTACHTDSAQFC